ncbi:MAG: tRNA (guanosine(37)-N1)-methyltransferase TrmD [Planctomycetes bacterium]|nr:tRNA (guanosine(37)-N1)-methyltransferase TrmD [Planctomycetota bacterium]
MRIDILTIFPEMFPGILDVGMLRIAQEKGLVDFRLHDFRDFAKGLHRNVDDRPFGGGPGMVLKPEPIYECLESFIPRDGPQPTMIALTPQGERYNQNMAQELAQQDWLVLLAGRYEGFDQRIIDGLRLREISIGDYVLTGGELPALVLVDSIVRLRPGVLGDADSATEESFSFGLLDHPHYTRPVEFRGMQVPEVLRSGDHARIARWRREQAEATTRRNRPDLLPPGEGGERRDD